MKNSNKKFKHIEEKESQLIIRRININCIVIFLLSLLIRWLIPSHVVINSPNDDYLGVLQAHNLLSGNWLGSWDQNVLSKPPGYAFFLYLVHWVPVDPTLILHFLYLLLGLYFRNLMSMRVVNKKPLNESLLDLSFLIFAFNPALLGQDFSKIYRTSLDSVLSLAITLQTLKIIYYYISSFKTLPSTNHSPKKERISKNLRKWGFLGILIGWKFLTRSEALWLIFPGIFVFILVVSKNFRKVIDTSKPLNSNSSKSSTIFAKSVSAGILTTLFFAVMPITLVSFQNKSYYGVYETENYFSGNFGRAYKLWEGVNAGRDSRLSVSISAGQRNAVYGISPTAALLQPIIEGSGPVAGWKNFNCQSPSKICDEAGPWFPWQLRDAAIATGKVKNEIEFQNFFGQIANDISNSCDRLEKFCGPTGTSVALGSWKFIPPKQIVGYAFNALNSLINLDSALNTLRPDSGNDQKQFNIWKETVHFNQVVFTNSYDGWKALDSVVELLRRIYLVLISLMILFGIVQIMFRKTRETDPLHQLTTTYLSLVIGLYLGGMALFEVATGFPAGFSEYCLPVQPIFLIFLIEISVGRGLVYLQKNEK